MSYKDQELNEMIVVITIIYSDKQIFSESFKEHVVLNEKYFKYIFTPNGGYSVNFPSYVFPSFSIGLLSNKAHLD